MYKTEKLFQMLTNRKASVRYDACEWLRVRQESSPEIVRALERATYDEDKEVSDRAKYALQADVHHQMAIAMGIIRPDKTEANRKIPAPPLGTGEIQVGVIVFGFLSIFYVITGLVSFVNTLSDQSLMKRSNSWPITKGEVISASIEKIQYESRTEEVPVITYQYSVSGIEYSCDIRTTLWDIYRKLPVGSLVTVYYDPDTPKECVSEFDTINLKFPWLDLISIIVGSFFVWLALQGLID